MKISRGFTLSEILIAMLVLGIIVAATVPVILNLTPNKNAIMMKKAYYATETIIQNLINDAYYYPEKDGVYGFYNTDEVTTTGSTSVTTSGNSKLKCLFISNLNIKEDLATACGSTSTVVTTMDGMSWYFSSNFGVNDSGTIEIDVDGLGKGEHAYNLDSGKGLCSADSNFGPSLCTQTLTARAKKKFDRISITVKLDGQISITDNQSAFEKIISGETKLIGGDEDK